jgi:hypothetical protein
LQETCRQTANAVTGMQKGGKRRPVAEIAFSQPRSKYQSTVRVRDLKVSAAILTKLAAPDTAEPIGLLMGIALRLALGKVIVKIPGGAFHL